MVTPSKTTSRTITVGLCVGGIAVVVFFSGCDREGPSVPITSQPAMQDTSVGGQSHVGAALIRFHDVAETSGVGFTYRNGFESGQFAIIQSLGGGCAISDIDVDGFSDLIFSGGGDFDSNNQPVGLTGAVYRNSGGLEFEEVTRDAAFTSARFFSHAVSTADFNNDGFPDVLITGYGGVTLFVNQGDGTFVDATENAGIDDASWSSSAAWGDIDGDGSLDLYVTHYVNWSPENNPVCLAGAKQDICPPRQFSGLTDSFLISNGDGSFREAGKEIGLVDGGKGLGVIVADFDLDGDLDIYVANDTEPNFHYIYDRDSGKLVESAAMTGTGLGANGSSEGSMGCDLGDFDVDGLPDIWVANYQGESFSLHRNRSNNIFLPAGRQTGVATLPGLYVGWGTLFADLDLDQDEDLLVTTGHVILYPANSTVAQRPVVLENIKGESFRNVASTAGLYMFESHEGRGLASGDLDHDGDLDFVVSHLNTPAAILKNETPTTSHWMLIKLIGHESTREAIGSRVHVKTATRTLVRQLKGGTSYASTSDSWLHFGLGPDESVQDVTVFWRSGVVTKIGSLEADHRYVIRESTSNATQFSD
jgi:enediyne biosynthesis protein E4